MLLYLKLFWTNVVFAYLLFFSLTITYLQMVRHNNYAGDELVGKEFGIQVRSELTSIEARVLPPPMVYC